VSLALLVSGCVQHPAHKEAGTQARVKSWHRIVSVNEVAPQDPFRVYLEPGQHSMLVAGKTLQVRYLCLFEFAAVAGQSYEIVDQSNPLPLVLFRWKRQNALWAWRLDPVYPVNCEEEAR
jgi:hypothetical protein